MRINCMEIFHYLAIQLKDVSNFECGPVTTQSITTGAIYNDFDCNPREALGGIDSNPTFSQEVAHPSSPEHNDSTVPRDCLDHAILEADRQHGILYEHLAFDSPAFDCTSIEANKSYMEKVYAIIALEDDVWKKLNVSESALKFFEMRRRVNWQGADTVYDAWLICNEYSREWFPHHKFKKLYPNIEEIIKRSSDKVHIKASGSSSSSSLSSSSSSSTSSSSSSTMSPSHLSIVPTKSPIKFMTAQEVEDFFSSPVKPHRESDDETETENDIESGQRMANNPKVAHDDDEGGDRGFLDHRNESFQHKLFSIKKEVTEIITIDSD